MADDVRNVLTALSTIGEPWQPHRLASVNDYDVKVVSDAGGEMTSALRELGE